MSGSLSSLFTTSLGFKGRWNTELGDLTPLSSLVFVACRYLMIVEGLLFSNEKRCLLHPTGRRYDAFSVIELFVLVNGVAADSVPSATRLIVFRDGATGTPTALDNVITHGAVFHCNASNALIRVLKAAPCAHHST